MVVGLVCSLPGAILVNRWLGPAWRGLGVIPSLIVLLPLARMFDEKFKGLKALEGEASSDSAVCIECDGMFAIHSMVAHNGLYVCARCKPIFLQKLAEGANLRDKP